MPFSLKVETKTDLRSFGRKIEELYWETADEVLGRRFKELLVSVQNKIRSTLSVDPKEGKSLPITADDYASKLRVVRREVDDGIEYVLGVPSGVKDIRSGQDFVLLAKKIEYGTSEQKPYPIWRAVSAEFKAEAPKIAKEIARSWAAKVNKLIG